MSDETPPVANPVVERSIPADHKDDPTGDPLTPQFRVWPQCATCKVAWVLRRCYSLSSGMTWLWQRDCKHKGDPIVGRLADEQATTNNT